MCTCAFVYVLVFRVITLLHFSYQFQFFTVLIFLYLKFLFNFLSILYFFFNFRLYEYQSIKGQGRTTAMWMAIGMKYWRTANPGENNNIQVRKVCGAE